MTARQKPDLSGEWKLDRQASLLSPVVAPTVQSGLLHIEHEEPRFSCHLTVMFDDKPVESRFTLLGMILGRGCDPQNAGIRWKPSSRGRPPAADAGG